MIDNSKVEIDQKQYDIVDTIEYNDSKFIYLSNMADSLDICIRKQITENGKNFLVGLQDDDEFNLALKLFQDKNK